MWPVRILSKLYCDIWFPIHSFAKLRNKQSTLYDYVIHIQYRTLHSSHLHTKLLNYFDLTQTPQNKDPKHIKCILRIIFRISSRLYNEPSIDWICANFWTHEINPFIFLRAHKITTTILRTNTHSTHLFVWI